MAAKRTLFLRRAYPFAAKTPFAAFKNPLALLVLKILKPQTLFKNKKFVRMWRLLIQRNGEKLREHKDSALSYQVRRDLIRYSLADGEGETSGTLAPPQEEEEEPISPYWSALVMMNDPVVIASGHTFDRPFIKEWLSRGHRVCPITQKPLTNCRLIPNYALPLFISCHLKGEEVHNKMKDPVIIQSGYTMDRDYIEDFLRKRGRLEHTKLIPNYAFHRIMSEHRKQRGLKPLPNLNQDDLSFGDLINRLTSSSNESQQKKALSQFELLTRHIPSLHPVGSQKDQVITALNWLVFNHPNDREIQELAAAVILNFCNRRDVKKNTAADKFLEAGPPEDEIEAARPGVLPELRSLSVISLVGSENIFYIGFRASSVRQKGKY